LRGESRSRGVAEVPKGRHDHALLFFACSVAAFTRWTTAEGRKCSGTMMVLPRCSDDGDARSGTGGSSAIAAAKQRARGSPGLTGHVPQKQNRSAGPKPPPASGISAWSKSSPLAQINRVSDGWLRFLSLSLSLSEDKDGSDLQSLSMQHPRVARVQVLSLSGCRVTGRTDRPEQRS
jgi:hypothetical protein